MFNERELQALLELKQIALRLNELLKDDSMHSLELYSEYPQKQYGRPWTSDLQQKNLLAESLCKKLDKLFYQRLDNNYQKRQAKRKVTETRYSIS